VPTYLLTDNERTVIVDHVAGVAVRHPEMVAVGRHYGSKIETCVPYDPETKGGVEATVKIAKRDLVPTAANLVDDYAIFAQLAEACELFCERCADAGNNLMGEGWPLPLLDRSAAASRDRLLVAPVAQTQQSVRGCWISIKGAVCTPAAETARLRPREQLASPRSSLPLLPRSSTAALLSSELEVVA
jgi:hypothetical protein